jgi:diguanylate cyclase (GGDEF)-like protein
MSDDTTRSNEVRASSQKRNRAGADQFAYRFVSDTVAYVMHRRADEKDSWPPARKQAADALLELNAAAEGRSWLSYKDLRHVLELVAVALGGPQELEDWLLWAFETGRAADINEPLRALGSPMAVLRTGPGMMKNVMPAFTTELIEVGDQEVTITVRSHQDLTLFPEMNYLLAGIFRPTPTLFGYPPATIEFESDGDPEKVCRLRIRWEEVEKASNRGNVVDEMRVRALEGTLDEFQDLVADVVSGKGPSEVLRRIVKATLTSSLAAQCALILKPGVLGERRVIEADGYEPAELERLADKLLAGKIQSDASVHVVDIASDERHHGYLVAVDHSGSVLIHAPKLVQTYARLAAAYLDAAIANELIRHNALHDVLTGLANRALILDRLEQVLLRSRRSHGSAAVLFLDLDGFKQINDTLGHEAGDLVLQAVATRLSTTVRQADTIGRLGGDEFVVLLDSATIDVAPELVAERLLTVLAEPFDLPTASTQALLTTSIGIAIGLGQTPTELLRDADVALYQAKQQGRHRVVVFAPEMQTTMRDRRLLEMDLRGALAADQYFLVYQPIFNLASGRVTAIEALLRWRHPKRGVVAPDDFIPLLEETGLIRDVGRWVLGEACREAARLSRHGYPLTITVNVAVSQLESPDFTDQVREALSVSDLPADQLILEITETSLMRDVEAVVPRLEMLRALGVRIAIDDFGTGYSSLAYLQHFPVDTIKIDRSFISAMCESSESATLVRTLVQLGKTLKLETLAEGIEEQGQYTSLQQEQCDSGQGYLFAKPLASDELMRFISEPQPTITA